MTRQNLLDFINRYPIFQLATVDEDTPRVRSIMMYRGDEHGIVFTTGKDKDLHEQLQKNPKVELCFFDPVHNQQARISGTAQLDENSALKQNILNASPVLAPLVQRCGLDAMAVYRVENALGTFWSLDRNQQSKQYIELF